MNFTVKQFLGINIFLCVSFLFPASLTAQTLPDGRKIFPMPREYVERRPDLADRSELITVLFKTKYRMILILKILIERMFW